MIGYSDDAKVLDLLAPLRRLEPVPFAVPARRRRPALLPKPVLVAGIVAVALALTGFAIADGLGAFNGLSRVQAQTNPVVLDAQTRAAIQNACSGPLAPTDPDFYNPYCHFVLDSARLLTDSGPRGEVYVIADTRGDLCMVGGLNTCGPPLGRAQPITFGGGNENPTTGGTFFAAGIAMDGVTSVSFTPTPGNGAEVTVPVKDNVWVYEEPDSHADDGHCIVANMADGSTVMPFPEVPCP